MIVHISAVDCDNFRLLVQFVYSNGSFSFGTTKHTGIKHSSEKFFFCHGELVDAIEVNVGLRRFGLWLKI